ncbi:pentapeptide repeat-containing protein [Limnoraphis robusta Tam1]|nr:pentapeptide repeat-containing protein [Limnoraphis robusta]MEA5539178.1 pentapeptide repeat-containing protein [Limnoraphis robusta Tam1]
MTTCFLLGKLSGMNAEELIQSYQSGARDFSAILLCEANLSRAVLSGANFSQAVLSITNLSGANLSEANLSRAKLNVAKLSGANLSQANLNGAVLNVANLIRADLSHATLINASLIRSELIRADLSYAILTSANLSEADLREATLRQVDLRQANLNNANLRDAVLIASNLEGTSLHAADLSRADLRGANLVNAELRQVNLSQANLSGANLKGANLRWADLNGADLRGANLEQARLSGASLYGADLSHASLLYTNLIHADLTQANLTGADWTGADLTGAALTGAKLYDVSRFEVKADEITCDWVDVSPNGDGSQVLRFSAQEAYQFFNATSPMVEISIDAALDADAHCALADAYRYIFRHSPMINRPPSIEVSSRRTTLSFRIERDEQLFPTAYVVILPFQDAVPTQQSIRNLVQMLGSENFISLSVRHSHQIGKLVSEIKQQLDQISDLKLRSQSLSQPESTQAFFASPTRTTLRNFHNRTLKIHSHPQFGRSLLNVPELINSSGYSQEKYFEMMAPSLENLADFLTFSNQVEM